MISSACASNDGRCSAAPLLGWVGAVSRNSLCGRPYPAIIAASPHVLSVSKTFDAVCRLAEIVLLMESRAHHTKLALAEAALGVAFRRACKHIGTRCGLFELHTSTNRFLSHSQVVWDSRRMLPRYAQDFCDLLAAHVRSSQSVVCRTLDPVSANCPLTCRRKRPLTTGNRPPEKLSRELLVLVAHPDPRPIISDGLGNQAH